MFKVKVKSTFHKSFEVANLVFYSWLRSKQHIKKSELHDLLQGRTLFYVYTHEIITRGLQQRLRSYRGVDAVRFIRR
jgi:hypothetical protein